MKIIQGEQGTVQHWLAKRGTPSASNFDRIITPKTAKLSASADDLACELIGDLYRPEPPTQEELDRCNSKAMQHGRDTEEEARTWYSMETGRDVAQCMLCLTDDCRFCCSPDGMVGMSPGQLHALDEIGLRKDSDKSNPCGGLELKCPQPKTHVRYLLDGELPSEYRCQVHGSLVVTGLPFWDFVSYCPGLPPFMLRVEPDAFTKQLAAALEAFHVRYMTILAKIKEKQ